MEIIRDIIPAANDNRPGLAMTPLYLTVHDTGNLSAGARNHADYLKRRSTRSSWHFTVDDKEIFQHLELNESGWHAGDGYNGTGNRKSIGIEICMHEGQDRAKAEENAARLIAHLLKTVPSLKPFPEAMKQHYDWTKKNCPQILRARPNGWEGFLELTRKQIGQGNVPQWKLDLMKKAGELGLIDPAQHSPNEPVEKWFVLAVALNLNNLIEGRK
jgi:N-acetylmuramoyl-L-alanine amidase